MAQALSNRSYSVEGPHTDALAAITPDDSNDLATFARALWVGGAGNISLDTLDGTTILVSGVTAGTYLPVSTRRVRATTTTATLIVPLL